MATSDHPTKRPEGGVRYLRCGACGQAWHASSGVSLEVWTHGHVCEPVLPGFEHFIDLVDPGAGATA